MSDELPSTDEIPGNGFARAGYNLRFAVYVIADTDHSSRSDNCPPPPRGLVDEYSFTATPTGS